MITGDQILLHLIGDYLLQSDWMALNKTKAAWPAWCHALVYSLPFALITPLPAVWQNAPSGLAWLAIFWSHFFIDRFRLARYVVWAKNWLGPNRPWSECRETGYPADRPVWLTVWLLIIADNTLHLICNGLAMRCLP